MEKERNFGPFQPGQSQLGQPRYPECSSSSCVLPTECSAEGPHGSFVRVQQAQTFGGPAVMSVSHTIQHSENNSQKTQNLKRYSKCSLDYGETRLFARICDQLFFTGEFPEGNNIETLEVGTD